MESTDMQHQQYYRHHWIQDRQRQRQFQDQYYPPPPHNNNHGSGAGLTRFRSAPSSYFDTMKNNMMMMTTIMESTGNTTTTTTADINDNYDLLMQPVRPLSPETENIFARFNIESVSGDQATDFVKHQKPPPPPQTMGTGGIKIHTGNISNSNLARHSSSPAGLFDDILYYGWNNGSGSGNVGGGNNPLTTNINNESKPFTCSSELGQEPLMFNRQINDALLPPPPPPCSSGLNNRHLAAGFPSCSWDDPSLFSDNDEIINPPENQNGIGNCTSLVRGPPRGLLAHHLSLPPEKLAHFQDHHQAAPPLPCEIRARRGCATHPRSIAERVRRTKISERMRKLQDLVPNMDKQTNTADMLDLAVEYIKDLQNQVKMLTGKRARCTCSI